MLLQKEAIVENWGKGFLKFSENNLNQDTDLRMIKHLSEVTSYKEQEKTQAILNEVKRKVLKKFQEKISIFQQIKLLQ